MPNRPVALTVPVARNGHLMSAVSLQTAGVANYAVKRDWRRDLDQDIRREGEDYFQPNANIAIGNQPFPGVFEGMTISRVGTVATVTLPANMSVNPVHGGQTWLIEGADQAAYNGSKIIISHTARTFSFAVGGSPATPATGSITLRDPGPMNLVHMARRPNGKIALIVGSPTTLYRFFALDNGDYYEGNGTPAAYFEEPPLPNTPYFNDDPGEWIVIGHGFSINGTRWEAVSINGWSVFNNGVDLLMTYRVEDMFVVPIYELREQGIAAVGTIAATKGVLVAGDILEIFDTQMDNLMGFEGRTKSGSIMASQTGNTVTASEAFFTASMVGKTIVYNDDDSTQRNITGFTHSKVVTVDGAATTLPVNTFTIRTRASQVGSLFSGTTMVNSSMTAGSSVVTATGAIFNIGMVTKTIRFANGFERTISGFTSPTQVTLSGTAPTNSFSGIPFWIITDPTDYIVNSTSDLFTTDMVGRRIVWDTGEVRKIVAVASPTQVKVDQDGPIASGLVGLENLNSYAAYTKNQFIDRVQYRFIWGTPDEPRRWASVIPGSIEAGSRSLRLQFPVKSFSFGQEIIVLGAGVDGGNLSARIIFVAGLGSTLLLDTPAVTTVELGGVQALDAVGSIVGSEDLQGDSSGIIKMLDLKEDYLVIYKDTTTFLARFTGFPSAPWDFKDLQTPSAKSLHYRYTLVQVNGEYHLYAGRSAFYRFDLTNRRPVELELTEACQNIFYEQVHLGNTQRIFAADNGITKEVLFAFPSSTEDKALVFDYKNGRFATTSLGLTAGATVKRPETGLSIGETEDWFVMGNAAGVVTLYGKTDAAQGLWSNAKEIFYRRNLYPYSDAKIGYSSLMRGGASHFGDEYNEKDVLMFVLYLASQSPNAEVLFELFGFRNVAEPAILLASLPIVSVETENMIPMISRAHYFQEQLIVSGFDNPVRVVGKTWQVAGIQSRSTVRLQ